jgi:1,4-dihydroxy-2-naphthoate octaprenyltransferase
MRLPFLLLTPACVLLGASTAAWSGHPIELNLLLAAFVGAIAAHVSVNAFNEYDDFKSGLDFNTRPTPFSGGSGTLPRWPLKAFVARRTALVALAIVALVGAYFVAIRGAVLLPLGLGGMLLIVTYTRWITHSPLLCLIGPGIGFGLLMVMGTDFVLTGRFSWTSFAASLVPFFLVSDLLLLNQFPDVEADRKVGRRHLPITAGRRICVWVYTAFLAGAYLAVIAGWLLRVLPAEAFLALITLFLALPTIRGVARHADNPPRLVPYMAGSVAVILLTPTLLAVGLLVAR